MADGVVRACGQERPLFPEGALVRLHLDGDATAFDLLYRSYFARLSGFCYGRVRDFGLAEDLAQETLVRAWANLDRFSVDRPMWPWLRTIALRLTIDEHRRCRADPHPDPNRDVAVVDDITAVIEGPLLRDALDAMPWRYRRALVLRYVEDRSTADAAHVLGVSTGAYLQVLSRARRRLRRAYRRVAGQSSKSRVAA